MFVRLEGADSPRVAECYHALGVIFQALEERDEAKEAYRAAAFLFIRAYGETHMEVAKAINNLASVHDDLDELEEASRLYDQALQILRRLHGDESPLVLLAMDNLLSVLEDRGARDEALVLDKMLSSGTQRMLDAKQAQASALEKHWTIKAKRRAQNAVLQAAREAEAYSEAYPEDPEGAAGPGASQHNFAAAELPPLDPASPPPAFSLPAAVLPLPLPSGVRFFELQDGTGEEENDGPSPLSGMGHRAAPPRNSYAHMLPQAQTHAHHPQGSDVDAPPPILDLADDPPVACRLS